MLLYAGNIRGKIVMVFGFLFLPQIVPLIVPLFVPLVAPLIAPPVAPPIVPRFMPLIVKGAETNRKLIMFSVPILVLLDSGSRASAVPICESIPATK